MNKSKAGMMLGTAGIVAGLVYGMKKNKGIGHTVLYCSVFAVAGVLIGNAVTKFYE